MAFFFGGGTSRASGANKPEKVLRVQSSIEGKARPVLWGQNRLSGNLIWYGDFEHRGGGAGGKGSGGGKGGGGGGGKGGGKGGGQQVEYRTAVVIAMCEGPVVSFDRLWNNQSTERFNKLDLETYLGTYSQSTWGWLTARHPTEALPYRGLAYMAADHMPLGASPVLPNLTVEITATINSAIAGSKDADPKDIITDFLTNDYYGAEFPAANIGSLSLYSDYCLALGLVMSPIAMDQQEARQYLKEWLEATNSEAVWSGGQLTIVPYGDTAVTGNGSTYTPPSFSGYSLTDEDFKPPQGGNPDSVSSASGADPVQGARKNPDDQKNAIPVEFLNRANSYNPKVIDAKDDAGIAVNGLRRADVKQRHFFCTEAAAIMSAHLALGREAVRRTYAVTVGQEYILLDPMDVLLITDAKLALSAAPVRIKEITENQDYTLTLYVEEYLAGTGWAPGYNVEASAGFSPDYNADPGMVNQPVIWEPTYDLSQGQLAIWLAISGSDSSYGGCEIWVSTDNASYNFVGQLDGSTRMGTLFSALPSVSVATTGQTIDTTNTLQVDLAQVPNAQLTSGTQADALAGNTLIYLAETGEYLAYETATLITGQKYDLTYLVRGLYNTTPAAASDGSAFVRVVDGDVFPFLITADRIGATLYFKFLAYNQHGGGRQSLDEVVAYPYIVGGTPLTAAVADISNLSSVYVGTYTNLVWDEIADFRPIRYELRQGATFDTAQSLGDVAHPPFRVPGNGTFWVAAYATPSTTLKIYSSNPSSIVIAGAVIEQNVIASFDEAATGWTGTLGGTAAISGVDVVTTGGGDVFAAADIFALADLFNYGGQGTGTYEIPAAHQVLLTQVAPCIVTISWVGQGQPVGQDILTIADWLAETDILGFASTANTDIYPEIAVTQDGVSWGAWTKFTAGGAVSAIGYKARMQLVTNDALTQAVLSEFTFTVDVPDRSDHYNRLSVAAIGTSITFTPDGGATPAAFNGGPGGDTVPHVQGTILDAQAGDLLVISSLTASGCTVQVTNGGSGAARTVNILAQGY